MSPQVGRRASLGVVVPATNTVVEHDFAAVGPPGVTFHTARIPMGAGETADDDAFAALMAHVDAHVEDAVARAAEAEPDHMVMGMSSETFWEGVDGNEAFEDRVGDVAGTGVTTGARATEEALAALDAHRIAFVTPYQPVADERVRTYAEEAGYDVAAVHGLECESATAIAEVDQATLVAALREVNGPDLDAIVQVGTNLSMLRLAAETERWLGTPTVAINEAILWHALREVGVDDRFAEFGPLLSRY